MLWLKLPAVYWIRAVRLDILLVPDLKGNAFIFAPFNMMLAVSLLYVAFIMLCYVPSLPDLFRLFMMNGCWILSNASQMQTSVKTVIWFSSIILLMWYIIFLLNCLCIPWINPSKSWKMILLMCCSILFASILLKILHQYSSKIFIYSFLFVFVVGSLVLESR